MNLEDVKKLIAYSSIAHSGYMLVGGNPLQIQMQECGLIGVAL